MNRIDFFCSYIASYLYFPLLGHNWDTSRILFKLNGKGRAVEGLSLYWRCCIPHWAITERQPKNLISKAPYSLPDRWRVVSLVSVGKQWESNIQNIIRNNQLSKDTWAQVTDLNSSSCGDISNHLPSTNACLGGDGVGWEVCTRTCMCTWCTENIICLGWWI